MVTISLNADVASDASGSTLAVEVKQLGIPD